jgi:hypothetical protein
VLARRLLDDRRPRRSPSGSGGLSTLYITLILSTCAREGDRLSGRHWRVLVVTGGFVPLHRLQLRDLTARRVRLRALAAARRRRAPVGMHVSQRRGRRRSVGSRVSPALTALARGLLMSSQPPNHKGLNTMLRSVLSAPMLFAATITLVGCDLQTETFNYTPTGSLAPVKIVTNLDIGDVSIRPTTASGAVSIVAEAQWVAKKPSVKFSQTGTTLYVTADCVEEDIACRVDLSMTVPPQVALDIRGEESNIDVTGLDGAVTLNTAVGDIELDDMGGKLTLTVGDGRIVGGDLMSRDVTSITAEGSNTLEFVGGADNVNVTSTSGNVKLTVPPTSYRIDTASAAGEVDVDALASTTATKQIKVRSDKGNISIKPQLAVTHEPVDYKVGWRVEYADEPITLIFDKVIEDSRCPSGADCLWAGRFIASMTMLRRADNTKRVFEVELDKPISVLGYSVQLSDVRPLPKDGEPAPQLNTYIITAAVERQ